MKRLSKHLRDKEVLRLERSHQQSDLVVGDKSEVAKCYYVRDDKDGQPSYVFGYILISDLIKRGISKERPEYMGVHCFYANYYLNDMKFFKGSSLDFEVVNNVCVSVDTESEMFRQNVPMCYLS